MTWQGLTDKDNGGKKITTGTTILEGLQEYAKKTGFEIITDPARASEADAVILAVGENRTRNLKAIPLICRSKEALA